MPPHKNSVFEVVVLDDPWSELGALRPVPPLNQKPTVPYRVSRPWQVWCGVFALTLAWHVMLAMALLVNQKDHRVMGHIESRFSQSAGGGMVSTLLLIADSSGATVDRQKTAVEAIVKSIPAQSVALQDVTQMPSVEVMSGGAAPRTLEGIYIDQIRARIQRSWSQSSSVRAAVGGCNVKIVQSERGDVQQVEFERCLGTPTWKETLERAIRQASPLPAPPQEDVFMSEVMLEF